MKDKNEQETFWLDKKWADSYIKRNNVELIKSNINLFSKIINKTIGITSIIEFGSNIGLNLISLQRILPDVSYSAVEINDDACMEMSKLEFIKIHNQSLLNFETNEQKNLSFTKGVLIHIHPEDLDIAYKTLYDSSNKYILIVEYYNPTPVSIDYRGHENKLFKRDFAGDIMDKYNDLKLIDYGFTYHRDNNFPQDDMTWFLLQK